MENGKTGDSTNERVLSTSRILNAPRELVFEAFRDPEHLAKWWGPKDFTNSFEKFDFRVGGEWRFVMHGPNGANFQNLNVFEEIVEPEKIVFNHVSNPKFKMTITLTEQGKGKTLLTWHMLFELASDVEKVKSFAVPANEENLDKLEARLAAMMP